MSKKKDKDDEEMTVVNMNVEGMRGYKNESEKKWSKDVKGLRLTGKERRAIFLGAIKSVFPTLICILVGFGLVVGLMYLWLKP